MKTNYLFITLIAAGLISFSCKKDTVSNTTTPPVTTSGVITYNDGNAIAVDSANAVLYTTSQVGGPAQREIDVYAFKGGMQVLEFHFLPKTGAQPVAQDFNSAWLTYMTNNGISFPADYYNCISGSFNLTTCDTVANKLIGTFSFIGNNGSANKSITAGTINMSTLKKQ
jgi:hypothetical protein